MNSCYHFFYTSSFFGAIPPRFFAVFLSLLLSVAWDKEGKHTTIATAITSNTNLAMTACKLMGWGLGGGVPVAKAFIAPASVL